MATEGCLRAGDMCAEGWPHSCKAWSDGAAAGLCTCLDCAEVIAAECYLRALRWGYARWRLAVFMLSVAMGLQQLYACASTVLG
jgi:hypothetical protein